MNNMYHFNAVTVPQELHQALWDAYDAVLAKREHIARINAGQRDIEQEIKAAQDELDAAKKSHLAGIADISGGATSLSQEAKDAKAKIAELGGRIHGLKDTLPDFGDAKRAAETEMRRLNKIFIRARRDVVKEFLVQIPKHTSKHKDLNGLLDFIEDGTKLDLAEIMTLYLAAHESVDGAVQGPFPQTGRNPMPFFQFMAKFFRRPSDEEIAVFRDRFNAAVWGDREPPERIPMPEPHKPNDGLGEMNWELIGKLG